VSAGQPAEPLLKVVSGNPTEEEVAALTAVVLSLAETPEKALAARPSPRAWVRRERLRLAPTPGPGSWRRSSFR
jgi:hypothetical protein